MSFTLPHRLERAVMAICPEIQARIDTPRLDTLDERALWWELSCCILSSQVPYGIASAAADAIAEAELLLVHDSGQAALAEALEDILMHRLELNGRPVRYRFSGSRAKQLAAAHAAVYGHEASLSALIQDFGDASQARQWLVKHIPGAGPKQASMFLRNTGLTYSLAILDRHVLNYMSEVGIGAHTQSYVSDMSTYLRLEQSLCEHATRIGYDVGLLDWAIWIVMRADKEPNMELDFA